MPPDLLFAALNPLAMAGWLMLAAAPLAPRLLPRIAGLAIPALLSLVYLVLILVHWSDAPGGYDSLASVMALLADPPLAVAGWAHFLAFDLFVGAWGWQQARAAGVPHLATLPALALTFLFGPTGFLAFLTLIALARLRAPHAA